MSVVTRLHPIAACGIAAVTFLFTQSDVAVFAQGGPDAKSDSIGYFLGLDIGGSLAQQQFKEGDFDPAVLALGIADALAGKKSQLSPEELQAAQGKLQALMQKRMQQVQEEMQKAAEMNKEKGALYLETVAKKKGVRKLDSGVLIETVTEGDGASPTPADRVTVHYTGKLIDGTKFDSSVDRGQPASFELGQVIKGWQIALQKMKVGEKAMVYIPSDMAYGMRGSPPKIGPNEVLVFEVELLEIP